MWFASNNGLQRYDGNTLKIYRNIPGDTSSLAGDYITKLAITNEHSIWVGTGGKGLHLLQLETGKFQRFIKSNNCRNCLTHNRIGALLADKKQVWIGTIGGGINQYDLQEKHFSEWVKTDSSTELQEINDLLLSSEQELWLATKTGLVVLDIDQKHATLLPGPLDSNHSRVSVTTIAQDAFGKLWCGTLTSGIFQYDEPTNTFLKIPIPLPGAGWQHIWDLLPDGKGKIWIATEAGLALLHEEDGIWNMYPIPAHQERTASLYKSKDGVLWVGTNHGVKLFAPREKSFRVDSLPEAIAGAYLHGPVTNGQLWVGSYQGLLQYDVQNHRFHRDFLKEHPGLKRFNQWFVSGLLHDSQDQLWIAEIKNFGANSSFFRYDLKTKVLTDFSEQFREADWYTTRQIIEGPKGNIWIANDNQDGLLGYNKQSNTFSTFPVYPPDAIIKGARAFFSDPTGFLWIGWMEAGLTRYSPETGEVVHYQSSNEKKDQLVHNSIWWIKDGGKDQLFIGTEGGLSILNKQTGECVNFTIQEGLLDAKVDNILKDQEQRIWLTTRHGLYRIDLHSQTLRHFDQQDGLEFDLFVGQSAYRFTDGTLLFGGNNGVVRFHPDEILPHTFQPPVNLTQFQLFNKEVNPTLQNGILPQQINFAEHIHLRHDQNVITFHYSALSFVNHAKHQYAYWLEPFEKDWQYVNDRKSVTYTNLNPGKYTFRLQAINADGITSQQERILQINVAPPWYWAWWSKLLYLFIVAGILYSIYSFQLRRRLEKAEAKRLRELDQIKNKLYTDITHEFRTPLTVISGMADQVMSDPEHWFRDGLAMIKRNSQQILQLINQILDLSKVESGSLTTTYVQGDLISFLNYLTESMQLFAATKNIQLQLNASVEVLNMDYDPEKIQTIFLNLVSNAIKYSPEHETVTITVHKQMKASEPYCQISIIDTGPGIPEEHLPYLFDRYYQADHSVQSEVDGSGIGLALTKELVHLLEGQIEVNSQLHKGTEFIFWLPIRNKSINKAEKPKSFTTPLLFPVPSTASYAAGGNNEDAPLALLIEDHEDTLQYLISCLDKRYQLLTAVNGEEGIQKAMATVPDIIISDIKMPVKDGFEVLTILKKDERTSHIPIVLLTGGADTASRIKGLEFGADAYITKPFEEKELQVRLKQLIQSRRQLQARYRSLTSDTSSQIQNFAQQDQFLNKVRHLLEHHLSDENFGILQLCERLGISRIQLHRKLKALTGLSTSHVIRSIRLKRAKELLEETDLSVSEIAYQTGFKSSNYFSQVFKQEFQQSPTDFRKK